VIAFNYLLAKPHKCSYRTFKNFAVSIWYNNTLAITYYWLLLGLFLQLHIMLLYAGFFSYKCISIFNYKHSVILHSIQNLNMFYKNTNDNHKIVKSPTITLWINNHFWNYPIYLHSLMYFLNYIILNHYDFTTEFIHHYGFI
jgi:hypothetical protein